jgi:hypothetical protein
MIDDDTVYWVTEWDGPPASWGGTTIGVGLLKGNTLMEIRGVSYMESRTTQDDLDDMWADHLEWAEEGRDGIKLTTVSDEEAQKLIEDAFEPDVSIEDVETEGEIAYAEDKDPEDNPYADDDDEDLIEAWERGWCKAFKRDTGREYDEQDEVEREEEQEIADEAASQDTMARWFHEEMAGG